MHLRSVKKILSHLQIGAAAALLFSAASLTAQLAGTGLPRTENISRTNYKAGTQNWAVAQDERGFVYVGNNKGLLEFDGSSGRLYPLPNRTIVRSLALGEDGLLYVGGQNEFGYFRIDGSGGMDFTSLKHRLPKRSPAFDDVWNIFIGEEVVLFCTEKAIFAVGDSTAEVILPVGERFENFFSVRKRIFCQDVDAGLLELRNGSFTVAADLSELRGERVAAALPHGREDILLSTSTRGNYILKPDGRLIPRYTELSDFCRENRAYCAIKTSDGNYAVGTAGNGLVIADTSGAILTEINRDSELQNNTVLAVAEDRQGNVWLGLDNGISVVALKSPFLFLGAESGVKGTGYASLFHEGRLILGTNQGLYDESPAAKDQSPRFRPLSPGAGQVWSIDTWHGETIVSAHEGAYVYRNGSLTPIGGMRGVWKIAPLTAGSDKALAGTYTGLSLLTEDPVSPSGFRAERVKGSPDESARIFEQDGEGYIWVSHAYKGLYRISLSEDGRSVKQSKVYGPEEGLPDELFVNVVKLRSEIVVTGPLGIYRYNRLADRFEQHEDLEALIGHGRNVHRLAEDEAGRIWFSVDEEFGAIVSGDEGPEKVYFNQLQPLLVDGFEHLRAFPDGRVLVGSEEGFVIFDPEASVGSEFPFPLFLRASIATADADSVVFAGSDSRAEKVTPEFPYRLNDFRFEFTAPFFGEGDKLRYSYQLIGFDKTPSGYTADNKKEYSYLPQGNYTFRVTAINPYGTESAPVEYTFRVLPPWYASVYAKSAYAVLALIGIVLLFVTVSRREKKKTEAFKREQTKRLKQKEDEYRKEVERSESELTELRNEKLRADISHKTSQLASATMHLVQKTEILRKLKEDLKKLRHDAPDGLSRKISGLERTIESDIQLDNNWEQFEIYFDQVHENFFKRLRQKFPELTPKDQKLCAYLRMNLSTKEIAPLLNISVRGVEISRYRLRKKLDIDSEVNLTEFITEV